MVASGSPGGGQTLVPELLVVLEAPYLEDALAPAGEEVRPAEPERTSTGLALSFYYSP